MNISLKRILAVILSLGILLSLTGCQTDTSKAENTEDEILNVALGSEPASLDPALSLTIDVRSYLSHLFEGLTAFDATGKVIPAAAETWTNSDNTEFVFTIREDAVWTDGTPVTADDFKYAWLRVLNPETASGWASYLYYIKGAKSYNEGIGTAEDVGISVDTDGKLVVTLENPCAFFLSLTAMQPYYPVRQDVIENKGDVWTLSDDTIVTNGCYKLDQWAHDESILLSKNELHWNAKNVGFDSIRFYLLDDSSATMNAYESDVIDFVEGILTSNEMEQIATVQSCDEYTITKFLSLNLNNEVFSDPRVRQAISIALDRNSIAELMGTGYYALCSWVPYGFINTGTGHDYRDEAEYVSYFSATAEIEAAQTLMEEAGYPNGEGFPAVDYLTNTSASNIQLAEIIKEQLKQIGITVNVVAYESKVFNEYRANRDFDIVAASWAAEYPDISSYFYGFQSADINNYASFNNEQYDKLYIDALATEEISSRYDLYHQAEDLVMGTYCAVPLYAINTQYIAKDGLINFTHDVTGCLNFNYAEYRR